MESIMIYPDKGYDVEISIAEHNNIPSYTADIKYPCGELVEGYSHFTSKRNAVLWAVKEVNLLGIAHHEGCTNEYCNN